MRTAERKEVKSVPQMGEPRKRQYRKRQCRKRASLGGGPGDEVGAGIGTGASAPGASDHAASRSAKKTAAVMLEVLSGQRDTTSASEALGIAMSRYYVLEARAVAGLVKALEPRPKGKQNSPEVALREARAEVVQLQRDVARGQALLRVSQRSLGVKVSSKKPRKGSKLGASTKSGTKKKRRRRTVRRAAQVIARLRSEPEAAPVAPGVPASGEPDNGRPQSDRPGAPVVASQEAERCDPDARPKA